MAVETLPYLAAVGRMIRAAGRRVGEADEFELYELVALREVLEEAIESAVHGQRATVGRSWADIGSALGISRQAAHQRYGRHEPGSGPLVFCDTHGADAHRESPACVAVHLVGPAGPLPSMSAEETLDPRAIR